ncbi:unnamed protein product [Meloidogyne enterolobii]|uniref:Uncharacterized protein n=1 Tax=Meloidogyne enterolobii TaxID=390850 RepID=A0ACB1ABA3_MELEN
MEMSLSYIIVMFFRVRSKSWESSPTEIPDFRFILKSSVSISQLTIFYISKFFFTFFKFRKNEKYIDYSASPEPQI